MLSGSNCDATYHGTLLGFHNGFCGFIEDLPAENSLEAAARRQAALDYIGDHLDRLPWSSPPGSAAVGAYGQVQMARIAQAVRPAGGGIAGGSAIFWALVPLRYWALGQGAGQPLWPLVASS